ncbi:MAG: hypothetical protein K2X77_22645 [Candidatus Obscuribacterales bacterium]|jgi:hypothetical protein|nr:hypothetical protein [Candidatus Obscuribacterales bacterium]
MDTKIKNSELEKETIKDASAKLLSDTLSNSAGNKGIGDRLAKAAASTASTLPEMSIQGEGHDGKGKNSTSIKNENALKTDNKTSTKIDQPTQAVKEKGEMNSPDPNKASEGDDELKKPMDCGLDPISEGDGTAPPRTSVDGPENNNPQGKDAPMNESNDEETSEESDSKPEAAPSDDISVPTSAVEYNVPREMGSDAGQEKDGLPNEAHDDLLRDSGLLPVGSNPS